MTLKDLILHERNISLIYFLPLLSYIVYYFARANVDGIREFIPLRLLMILLVAVELLLVILPTVSAVAGLKRKTIRKVPAVLIILTPTLILLYYIFMATVGGGIGRFTLVDCTTMIFHFAVPLSILYGFAAFAVQNKTANAKAAKVLGILHALAGAGMTFFYYKIYNTAQAYDYGVPIPDVWYYSPESLLIGYGIWALLGAAAGILMLTDKTKS